MIKESGIKTRIKKVNDELSRLADILESDEILYAEAKEILHDFNANDSSENSLEDFAFDQIVSKSKGFSKLKIETISNSSEQNLNSDTDLATKNKIRNLPQRSCFREEFSHHEPGAADTTIKKFHPSSGDSEKKKLRKNKSKTNSKAKNVKSEKVFMPSKPESIKKYKDKPDKELKKSGLISSQMKNNFKKIKTLQNKSTSHNRLNESLKMQINLKKEAIMKITDLNIQKQHCQRESQYLRSAVKVTQEKVDEMSDLLTHHPNDENRVKIMMGKVVVKFFSQFFVEKMNYEELTNGELKLIFNKPNYLCEYLIRLPDILKRDNTLCEDRCRSLFEEKHLIDRKVSSCRSVTQDQFYLYLDTLNEYISFLLNNNMVRETKRKSIPVEFHSERREELKNIPTTKTIDRRENSRDYDSERRKQKSLGLKRTNTSKFLSPKVTSKLRK